MNVPTSGFASMNALPGCASSTIVRIATEFVPVVLLLLLQFGATGNAIVSRERAKPENSRLFAVTSKAAVC
jgi:hypothetical protein